MLVSGILMLATSIPSLILKACLTVLIRRSDFHVVVQGSFPTVSVIGPFHYGRIGSEVKAEIAKPQSVDDVFAAAGVFEFNAYFFQLQVRGNFVFGFEFWKNFAQVGSGIGILF